MDLRWASRPLLLIAFCAARSRGDLPVQLPTKFEMVVNRGTAKALGLALPPSILLRAVVCLPRHSRHVDAPAHAGYSPICESHTAQELRVVFSASILSQVLPSSLWPEVITLFTASLNGHSYRFLNSPYTTSSPPILAQAITKRRGRGLRSQGPEPAPDPCGL
jgi:hypothetical protein